ncbi:MAG: FAD-binding protein [Candidatus Lokiarchaeota archaeon]|nr:FAD-binding protein [Candidatus Lokiarchaeota archaeon]MBD3199104.1 FAD-binding protein [Candidatus Lokiarchaeota archaeon]
MSELEKAYGELEAIVGKDYITDKDFMKASYSRNVDPAFPDRWADLIIRPNNTKEISEIVKLANQYKIKITPRGGGADLVGGAATNQGILLDLTRMNRIIEINKDDFYCIVECGVTWGALISELYKIGLTTGVLGPGSGYSATIGGALSNSTAGFGSTKYGLVPDNCLGVEVVLPNPEGSIIVTGGKSNRFADPVCRYGVAPDFTGLFMGDAGILGIKTKAYLKLFPNSPFKIQRNYMLKKDKYEIVSKLMNAVQTEIREGLHDLYINPKVVVQLLGSQAEEKPEKRLRVSGPVFMFILEAFDERILDIYKEKLDTIMLKHARVFEWTEVDLKEKNSEDWVLNLQFPYSYFNKFISLAPPKISCTTCHKIPISKIKEKKLLSTQFDRNHQGEFPEDSFSLFARSIHLLPNGHCVFAGGFNAENIDGQRETAMKIWHKKVRAQVRYGGIHYWLGESISQSIVEADAYSSDFLSFFKNIKRTLDPNFILSPGKFHLYSNKDEMSNYIIQQDGEV